MKNEMKQAVKIGAIYSGAVIGAGFASGQELLLFFARFGIRGAWGLVLAGILFILLAVMILSAGKQRANGDFKTYIRQIFGTNLAEVYYLIIQIFMAVSFCVMISGSDALFCEQFGFPKGVGALLSALFCFFILQKGANCLAITNLILVPLMTVGMILVCVWFLLMQTEPVWFSGTDLRGNIFLSAILYVSYNMMTAAAVLVPISKTASCKKTAMLGGALGGGLLNLLAVLVFVVLVFAQNMMFLGEMPILRVSQTLGMWVSVLYAVVLLMAMMTTAVANGFSVMEHFTAKGGNRRLYAVLLCLASVLAAKIPFSKMLDTCYTFFGCLGICFLSAVVYDWFRNRKFK